MEGLDGVVGADAVGGGEGCELSGGGGFGLREAAVAVGGFDEIVVGGFGDDVGHELKLVGLDVVSVAGDVVDEVVGGAEGLADDGLVGARGDVGGDDGVGSREKRMIGGGRFDVEDVGSVAAEFAGVEGSNHVVDDHDLAAGAVEDDGTVAHLCDLLGIDHVAGGFVEEAVKGDDVGVVEDFVHVGAFVDLMGGGKFVVEVGIVCDDGHGEGARTGGDFFADAAEADDAHGFVHDFVADGFLPSGLPGTVFDVGGVDLDFPGDAEEEAEGVLGDGRVVDAGCEEDRDFVFGSVGDVDFVETDAVLADELEARK